MKYALFVEPCNFNWEEKMKQDDTFDVPLSIMTDNNLKPGLKLLYLILRYLDCPPNPLTATNMEMAALLNSSDVTVTNYLKTLEKKGYIKIGYERINHQGMVRKIWLKK